LKSQGFEADGASSSGGRGFGLAGTVCGAAADPGAGRTSTGAGSGGAADERGGVAFAFGWNLLRELRPGSSTSVGG